MSFIITLKTIDQIIEGVLKEQVLGIPDDLPSDPESAIALLECILQSTEPTLLELINVLNEERDCKNEFKKDVKKIKNEE